MIYRKKVLNFVKLVTVENTFIPLNFEVEKERFLHVPAANLALIFAVLNLEKK